MKKSNLGILVAVLVFAVITPKLLAQSGPGTTPIPDAVAPSQVNPNGPSAPTANNPYAPAPLPTPAPTTVQAATVTAPAVTAPTVAAPSQQQTPPTTATAGTKFVAPPLQGPAPLAVPNSAAGIPPATATSNLPPNTSGPVAPVVAAGPTIPPTPEMTDPLLEGFFDDIQYNPADKRDPFLPYFAKANLKMAQGMQNVPLEPLQQFALTDLKIIGIIWDVGHPKALLIDPAGKSHIVIENTKLGKEFGYVAAIREGEVIVVEPIQDPDGKKGYQTKILRLAKQ